MISLRSTIQKKKKQEKDKKENYFLFVCVMFRYLQVGNGDVYYTLIVEYRGSAFHKSKNGSGDFAGF